MVNFLMRQMFQLSVALVLCAPALLADTFQLAGGASPFGDSPVFSRPNKATTAGVTGIQAIVNEFRTTAPQNQPPYAADIRASRTRLSAKQVVKFEFTGQDRHTDYMVAAFLAIQMIGIDRSTAFGRSQTGVLNNALWGLFYRPAVNHHGFIPHNSGPRYLAQAQPGRGYQSVPNVNIWRPSPKDPPREPKPVRVPEPSLAWQLAFEALVLTVVGLCLRRRGVGFVN